jgi:hypothetical protein
MRQPSCRQRQRRLLGAGRTMCGSGPDEHARLCGNRWTLRSTHGKQRDHCHRHSAEHEGDADDEKCHIEIGSGKRAPFLLLSTPILGSRPQAAVSVACGVPVNELTPCAPCGPARARASLTSRRGGRAWVRDWANCDAPGDGDHATGSRAADRVVARCRTRSADIPTVTWRATGRPRLRLRRA